MSVTTIVITDPELLAKIAAADGQIVFQGPTGETIKTVETRPFGVPPPGYQLPISDEELERRRQEKSGRTLEEILADLRQKHGGR
ncbi:MAG TPA: hypothetical protein VM529_22900 [Gemmata sp.]|nr:hypothetical protein [Gemmata sp.]